MGVLEIEYDDASFGDMDISWALAFSRWEDRILLSIFRNYASEVATYYQEFKCLLTLEEMLRPPVRSQSLAWLLKQIEDRNIVLRKLFWVDFYDQLPKAIFVQSIHFVLFLIRHGVDIFKKYTLLNFGMKTATSLSLLSSRSFYFWKDSLHITAVDMYDFVTRECENGTVSEEGWELDGLLALFDDEEQFVSTLGEYDCEICPRCEKRYDFGYWWCTKTQPFVVPVEVEWRLRLEKFKRKRVTDPNTVRTGNGSFEDQVRELAIRPSCLQGYPAVCQHCWFEPQAHSHDIPLSIPPNDSELALTSDDELSDSEYSPYLFTI